MKRLYILILCVILLTSGCSSSQSSSINSDNTVEDNESSSSTTVESMSSEASEEETFAASTTIESTTTSENEVIGTKLFETVYFPYANRDNSFAFNSVKTYVESTDYDAEIIEPTSDEVGMITVSEENGDNVFFSFSPINGVETIMTVSYFCSDKQTEVSLSNYSTNGSPQYDCFEVHVLGQNANEVKNVNEQRIFLFQN